MPAVCEFLVIGFMVSHSRSSSVSTVIVDTNLTGAVSISQESCEHKKDKAIVIINCTENEVVNCTCCDDLVFCVDKELPPSLNDQVYF